LSPDTTSILLTMTRLELDSARPYGSESILTIFRRPIPYPKQNEGLEVSWWHSVNLHWYKSSHGLTLMNFDLTDQYYRRRGDVCKSRSL
jgi:hypothetical protein